MNKIRLYRNAIVEVHDNNEVYLSAIPWSVYLKTRLGQLLHLVTFDNTFSLRLVFPWQIVIDSK